MISPFEELSAWINRDPLARSASLDALGDETNAKARVILYFENANGDEREVQGTGPTYDDAVLAALGALPGEVRR